jgi:riboflavin biosynthesis pyrimidine reductase
MRQVIVSANLIVGVDGSTTANGSSIGLSNDEDRRRFHQLREKSDLIVIGGNTARREPYKRTPVPLYILTHSKVRLQPKNQLAKQFQLTPGQLIEDVRKNFEGGKSNSVINLLVESGPKMLLEMINESLVDYLYLTVNLNEKGENPISVHELVKGFNLISSESKDGFEFRCYQKLSY